MYQENTYKFLPKLKHMLFFYFTEVTYIGCFTDPSRIDIFHPLTKILDASFIDEPSMTIPYCLSICEVEGHRFAGLRVNYCYI